MITKFGCKNIKAIKDYEEIEIRPITIIMGENSSGKSSILQALSLLSVNKIFGNNIQKIKYDNPFSQFGDNNSFKNKGENIEFYFEFTQENTKIFLKYIDDNTSKEYGVLQEMIIKNFNLEYSFKLNDNGSYDIKIDKVINSNYKILEKYQMTASSKFNSIMFITDRNMEEHFNISELIFKPLDLLRENFTAIRHIGTIQNKKETYDYSLDYIGYFGEKYKDRVLSLSNTRFIKNAIREIFDYELVVDKNKQELFLKQDNKKLQLHMFGSSISSTIPILVQFAKNREKDIKDKYRLTIVEEPELNLHPKSQAKFVEAIFTKNRPKKHYTILETHSDHILNKIRFLISKKIIKSQDVVVYYKEKNTKFKKIEINKCGEFVTNFPKGFYDATLEDIYNLGKDC